MHTEYTSSAYLPGLQKCLSGRWGKVRTYISMVTCFLPVSAPGSNIHILSLARFSSSMEQNDRVGWSDLRDKPMCDRLLSPRKCAGMDSGYPQRNTSICYALLPAFQLWRSLLLTVLITSLLQGTSLDLRFFAVFFKVRRKSLATESPEKAWWNVDSHSPVQTPFLASQTTEKVPDSCIHRELPRSIHGHHGDSLLGEPWAGAQNCQSFVWIHKCGRPFQSSGRAVRLPALLCSVMSAPGFLPPSSLSPWGLPRPLCRWMLCLFQLSPANPSQSRNVSSVHLHDSLWLSGFEHVL